MSVLIGFVCLLLAGFLIALPSARKRANLFLALFLFLTAIEVSGWLWINEATYQSWANVARMTFSSLQMPVFLGFYLASCYSDFRLRRHHIVHLAPFLLTAILMAPGNQLFLMDGEAAGPGVKLTELETDALWAATHIWYYGYMLAVFAVLLQFRPLFAAHHAGARSELFVWLMQLAIISLIAHTLVFVRDLASFGPYQGLYIGLQALGAVLALAVTSWIALKSLLQPALFRSVDRALLQMSERPRKPHTDNTDASAHKTRLLAFMREEKPYLDPDLTLAALADRLALTPRELSELLNQSLGVRFFDFINHYRIEDAKARLTGETKISILEILHGVGFNSKSSFNTAFKKHTGMTPSAYRASPTHG